MTIDCKGKTASVDGCEVYLTPNEYDVLNYLMANAERAVSREELLKNIWGYETHVESRATDDTIRRLRRKICKGNVIIDAVWGFGFKLKIGEHE